MLEKELGIVHKLQVAKIPFVITWDEIVTKYHITHTKKIEIDNKTRMCIQSIVMQKTIELVFLNHISNDMLIGASRAAEVAETFDEAARLAEVCARNGYSMFKSKQ